MQYDENAEKYGYEGEMTPMKCDELEAYGMDDPAIGEEYEMYKVADVDELLSEKNKEIRRLRRALYKACAKWAFLAQWERGALVENWEKWENMERKCLKKAEEYK